MNCVSGLPHRTIWPDPNSEEFHCISFPPISMTVPRQAGASSCLRRRILVWLATKCPATFPHTSAFATASQMCRATFCCNNSSKCNITFPSLCNKTITNFTTIYSPNQFYSHNHDVRQCVYGNYKGAYKRNKISTQVLLL